ncbi:shikimate kinase [Robiginitalea aurantiaca]|uniref:Shikimate kinase n=1 Tax=Robiginitalea aurantiaca TaxID=3056915 RepID=A0ABT7WI99_9FLAO|nr:shikimate kinase [Robiginitalea aurantiaca]MDM9632658.1 shikimate kinase [Robiginitalea aurantiaca]
MLIVLLGYMGSGKSTVGKALAERLNLPFTDLDTAIEEESGTTIPELFQNKGELYFRKLEHEILVGFLESGQDRVLSLGGGTPAYAGNMDRVVRATPNSFYLQHSIPSLVGRLVREKAQRPLIAHLPDSELPEFIGKHLFDRGPYYLKASHTLVSSDKLLEELLDEIEGKLV